MWILSIFIWNYIASFYEEPGLNVVVICGRLLCACKGEFCDSSGNKEMKSVRLFRETYKDDPEMTQYDHWPTDGVVSDACFFTPPHRRVEGSGNRKNNKPPQKKSRKGKGGRKKKPKTGANDEQQEQPDNKKTEEAGSFFFSCCARRRPAAFLGCACACLTLWWLYLTVTHIKFAGSEPNYPTLVFLHESSIWNVPSSLLHSPTY